MASITLEDLIKEGAEIRTGISYIKADGFIRTYSAYKISDTAKYERWKSKVIRFLESNFPNDRCIADFETAVSKFEGAHNLPQIFDRLIGILESCVSIPAISHISNTQAPAVDKSININVSQSQSQNQTQEQAVVIAVEIFREAIKDELTGKQLKEIKAIIATESDPKEARIKIFGKIKSFGLDITSNIIANILTNPAILGGMQ